MKQLAIALATAGLLSVGMLGATATASAVATGNRSAADTVARLQADGHHVQLNGSSHVPLSLCKVTGVHGMNNSNIDSSGSKIDDDLFSTVYVDVDCQDG